MLAVSFNDGTAALPGIAFNSDPTTGIYRPASSQLGLSTAGVVRRTITSSSETATLPQRGADGTQSAPQYSFSADPNSGIYKIATSTLGISTNSTLRVTISTSAITSTLPLTIGTTTYNDQASISPNITKDGGTNLYGTTQTHTLYTLKTGNLVTLFWGRSYSAANTNVSAAYMTFSAALAAAYRPATEVNGVAVVFYSGSLDYSGIVKVETDGNVRFYRSGESTISSGTSWYVYGGSISYKV